jgi:hypothetical protein
MVFPEEVSAFSLAEREKDMKYTMDPNAIINPRVPTMNITYASARQSILNASASAAFVVENGREVVARSLCVRYFFRAEAVIFSALGGLILYSDHDLIPCMVRDPSAPRRPGNAGGAL